MNNNLEQHKRSDKAKWAFTAIAFILVFVMLGGLIAAVVTETNPADWIQALKDRTETEGETPEGETTDDGGLTVTVDEDANAAVQQNGEGIILNMIHLSSAGVELVENTLQKVLTATVLPENAPNKTVDWEIAWGDNGLEAPVTDYLTITPEADGSTTATLTCYQGFGDATIIVTVRTRAGNYSATCICTYDGAPDSLEISYDGTPIDNSGEFLTFTPGTYTFDLSLNNDFGYLGSSYGGNYEVESVKLTGRFMLQSGVYNTGGVLEKTLSSIDGLYQEVYFDNSESTLSYIKHIEDVNVEYNCSHGEQIFLSSSEFVNANIVDGKLQVNVITDPTGFVMRCNVLYSSRFNYTVRSKFSEWSTNHSYSTPEYMTANITVKDIDSGISNNIVIKLAPAVQSVSLSTSEVFF